MSQESKNPLSRRRLFAGAATIGAVAAAASLVPGAVRQDAPVADAKQPPPPRGGGYQLTEHVKRYYQTTLV